MLQFDNLKEAKNFLRLFVKGKYGKGLTQSDLEIDFANSHFNMKSLKLCDIFIVIRATGTQGIFHTYERAYEEALQWSNSEYIICISYNDDKIGISSQKIH